MASRLIGVTAVLAVAIVLGFSSSAGALAPTTTNTIIDVAGTTTPVTGPLPLGSSVVDTATVGPQTTPVASGTVTYTLYEGACGDTSTPIYSDPGETLDSGGNVPNSTASPPLGAGSYYFSASYSGDATYASSLDTCEAFTVNKGDLTLSTSAYLSTDPGQITPINNTSIGLGTSVFDQATLSGAASGIAPAGTVSYTFFTNGACNATGSAAGSSAPPPMASNTEGPLGTGNYSFSSTYSGDSNYNTISSSLCESFSVGMQSTSTSTTIDKAGTTTPVTAPLPLGSSVIDTASVGPQTTPVASGTVTYTLYEGACGDTSTPIYSDPGVVLDSGGNVPNSAASPALKAGSYFYTASYSGDGNYGASSDSCEAFTVNKGASSLTTKVYLSTDGGESSPINGANVPFGSSVYDQATLSGVTTGFVPTGSVSYTFFTNGSCSNSGTTQTLNVIGGNVQRSAVSSTGAIGSYAFEAVYNGDANYPAENAGCEAFSVGRAASTTPSITNLPFNPLAEGGFTATVSTNGDGTRSVVSSTTGVCTVGNNGLTVSYVAPGSCTLTAQVAQGATHLYATGSPQTFTILRVPHGYWLVGSDGGIFTFGDSQFWGSTGNLRLQRPVVGITPTVSRNGYWLVASDGGIFSFGDAGFYGSIPGLGLHPAGSGAAPSLNAPIVAMVPSTTGHGYFMVASDGGVFAFGDARFAGSCPGIGGCAGSAVAVVPDATGKGYWLFTNSGNVYTFGDAPYYGAPPATGVPVASAVATPDGHGYWILFSNGEVASFGDAPGLGSPVGYTNSANPATAIFPTANGGGYWVGSARGDVFAFGDAPFLGSMAGTPLNGMIIAASGY
jgi:Bacterial Ig-like domain (group 3)